MPEMKHSSYGTTNTLPTVLVKQILEYSDVHKSRRNGGSCRDTRVQTVYNRENCWRSNTGLRIILRRHGIDAL